MQEAAATLSMFDKYGLVGLMMGVFFILFFLLILGFKWYVTSGREYKLAQDKRHNDQYERRLDVEKEWRASLDRNSNALHDLAAAINKRPCIGGDLRVNAGRRRETDRIENG